MLFNLHAVAIVFGLHVLDRCEPPPPQKKCMFEKQPLYIHVIHMHVLWNVDYNYIAKNCHVARQLFSMIIKPVIYRL